MKIRDSVVLITGAAQRVGRSVALSLAGHGAHIGFSYLSPDEPWAETLRDLKACGVQAHAVQADVTQVNQVRRLVDETITALGHIDVLVNNASVWLKKPVLEITEQEWDTALTVNLKGPFLVSQMVARHMQTRGNGLIINMTDLSAFQVWEGYAHHAASKAALVALTKTMALELAPTIRVNAIAPGTVLLPEGATDEKRAWAIDKSVLKRVGSPEDVARTVRYLIEEDFATGSVYFVDGGRLLM